MNRQYKETVTFSDQKPYPEYKTNKRARPKIARAPRNPKHHLITSNLNLDISLPL